MIYEISNAFSWKKLWLSDPSDSPKKVQK